MAKRTRGFQKKIDHVAWDGFSLNFLALGAGTIGTTFFNQLLDRPVTLMRIRGQVWGSVDGASGTGKAMQISMGIIKVPEGTSASIVYNPVADDKAPWLWYATFVLAYEEMVTDVVDVPVVSGYRETINNKAMRVIRPDEELQFVAENTTVGTAGAANVGISGRMLFGF